MARHRHSRSRTWSDLRPDWQHLEPGLAEQARHPWRRNLAGEIARFERLLRADLRHPDGIIVEAGDRWDFTS